MITIQMPAFLSLVKSQIVKIRDLLQNFPDVAVDEITWTCADLQKRIDVCLEKVENVVDSLHSDCSPSKLLILCTSHVGLLQTLHCTFYLIIIVTSASLCRGTKDLFLPNELWTTAD